MEYDNLEGLTRLHRRPKATKSSIEESKERQNSPDVAQQTTAKGKRRNRADNKCATFPNDTSLFVRKLFTKAEKKDLKDLQITQASIDYPSSSSEEELLRFELAEMKLMTLDRAERNAQQRRRKIARKAGRLLQVQASYTPVPKRKLDKEKDIEEQLLTYVPEIFKYNGSQAYHGLRNILDIPKDYYKTKKINWKGLPIGEMVQGHVQQSKDKETKTKTANSIADVLYGSSKNQLSPIKSQPLGLTGSFIEGEQDIEPSENVSRSELGEALQKLGGNNTKISQITQEIIDEDNASLYSRFTGNTSSISSIESYEFEDAERHINDRIRDYESKVTAYDIKRFFTKWKRAVYGKYKRAEISQKKNQLTSNQVDPSEPLLTDGLDQDKIFDSKMGKPLDLEFTRPDEAILRFLPNCNDVYRMKKN